MSLANSFYCSLTDFLYLFNPYFASKLAFEEVLFLLDFMASIRGDLFLFFITPGKNVIGSSKSLISLSS